MSSQPNVAFRLFLNDAGFSDSDKNELENLVSDIADTEVGRGMQQSPISEHVTFAIVVSGLLGGIAGGLLQAVGADVWNLLKRKLWEFFSKRKHFFSFWIECDDRRILLPMPQKDGAADFEMLDKLDAILAEIQDKIECGSIPPDASNVNALHYSEETQRWVATYVTEKSVMNDWSLYVETTEVTVELRKDRLKKGSPGSQGSATSEANRRLDNDEG